MKESGANAPIVMCDEQGDSARAERSRGRLTYSVAVIALAAVWLLMFRFGTGDFDRQLYRLLYAGGHAALVLIARLLTRIGEPGLLIEAAFVFAAWLWWSGRGWLGLVLLAAIWAGRYVEGMQKYWIARARPELEPHLVRVNSASFPSGHATNSMIFYLTLALVLAPEGRRRRLAAAAAVMLSLLIGLSRVMLGVHWPSDVIGGWAFGLLWVLLTVRPAERLLGHRDETTTAVNRQ